MPAVIVWAWLAVGILFMILAILGPNLPQNNLLGVRTRVTLEDKEAWRYVHGKLRLVFGLGALTFFGASWVGNPAVSLGAIFGYLALLVTAAMLVQRSVDRHPE